MRTVPPWPHRYDFFSLSSYLQGQLNCFCFVDPNDNGHHYHHPLPISRRMVPTNTSGENCRPHHRSHTTGHTPPVTHSRYLPLPVSPVISRYLPSHGAHQY